MEQICQEKVFNVPNVLTMIRIALLPVIAWYYKAGNTFAVLVVYLLAMATDAFDGIIARKTNQITSLGKLLDPLADKLTLLTLLSLFLFDGRIPGWVLLVIVIKEAVLVIGSGMALKHGIVVHALWIGKVTTVVCIISIVARLVEQNTLADMTMYIFVVLSFVSLIEYTWVLAAQLTEQSRVKSRAIR